MENVLKNNNILFKILSCLLIIMFIVFLHSSYVCAYDITTHGTTYTLNNEISSKFKYICSIEYNENIHIFCSDSPLIFRKSGSSYDLVSQEDGGKFYTYSIYYEKASELFDISLDKFGYGTTVSAGFTQPSAWTSENNAMSTYNLLTDDGNLVFQGASQELAGVTIPAIQSVGEIPQAMVQVMRILVPVGLIIFGIGLLIYLIKLVISRVQ